MNLSRLAEAFENWDPTQYPFQGATQRQIQTLHEVSLHKFGFPIPVGYAGLLGIVNGFIWNGLTIYAAESRILGGERSGLLEGFIEENGGIRLDRPEYTDLLVFGHGDMEYFVYRISDKKFLAIGRGGEGVFKTYKTFETMIAACIRRALK